MQNTYSTDELLIIIRIIKKFIFYNNSTNSWLVNRQARSEYRCTASTSMQIRQTSAECLTASHPLQHSY